MRNKGVYLGCIIVILLTIGIVIGKRELFNEFFSTVKLQYISTYLNNNYLYEFNEEKGLEMVYTGYLSGVENDATYYLEESDFLSAQVEDEGYYYGTGLSLMWSLDGQALIVTDVVPNSPADKENIKNGDRIIKINDTQVLMANAQVLIEEGFSTKPEPIRYTVLHNNEETEVSLTPTKVEIESLDAKVIDGALYIKIRSIQEQTSKELQALIEANKTEVLKGIILDLRDLNTNNIQEVAAICDLFLDEGIAFKVKEKNNEIQVYTMNKGHIDASLCILVNISTKAGGEALALGLSERCIVVGSETAGMNYLRTLVSLGDGSGMSVASGIICDEYGNELNKLEADERVYIGEDEKLEILEKGSVTREKDSFIKAAIRRLDEKENK